MTAMLRYFGSYSSYAEISAVLGVPVGTVRSRLNQVKVKLAEALLKTAGLEHGEARELTASQTRFFSAAFDATCKEVEVTGIGIVRIAGGEIVGRYGASGTLWA